MHTHLLHTSYAPTNSTEQEIDMNNPANDECYEKATVALKALPLIVLSPSAALQSKEQLSSTTQAPSDNNEDYWLGGYAGI